MKRTTPLWLFNKYKGAIMDRAMPIRRIEIGGLKFYYLGKEGPPHDPAEFERRGLEFHGQMDRVHGKVALDIGANIGSYTLHLAKRFGSVVAFEPSPEHFRLLKRNVESNRLTNVRVEQIAVDDRSGVFPLYMRDGGATSLNSSHYGLTHKSIVRVQTVSLDDYLAGSKGIDLLKIDAEGRELAILRGGTNSLNLFRPMLAVEVHAACDHSNDHCSCGVCRFLRRLDYDTKTLGELQGPFGDVHWVWGNPAV